MNHVNSQTDCNSVPVELLQKLLAESNIHRLLETITSHIEKLFPEVRVAIFTYDPKENRLSPASSPSLPFFQVDPEFSMEVRADGVTSSQAAYFKKLIWNSNIQSIPGSSQYDQFIKKFNFQFRGVISLPVLSARNELLGVFTFFYEKDLVELPKEIDFFRALTNLAALTLERYLTQKKTKAILAELEASQERLNLALRSQKMGVWDWYIQTDHLIWDETMLKIFGISPADTSGSLSDLESRVHPDDWEGTLKAIEKTFKGDNVFEHQFRIYRNGEIRYVAAVGYGVRDENGEAFRMTGLNWDVTDKVIAGRKLDQERAKAIANSKMASLGEMASGVAHEINNPLTIILNRANQLKSRLQNNQFEKEWALQEISKIENTVERIARIIRGLRAFSRNSDNDPMITCDFNSILEETLELCREKFKRFGITFSIRGFQNALYLRCRPSQISQVLLNLFNNSFDAIVNTQKPWVELSLSLEKNNVLIRVTDSGHGIPKNIADRMMDPFFSTKEVGRGTGLGLSISKGIIEDHGGRFYFDKDYANTSFVIELPIEDIQKPVIGSTVSLNYQRS